MNIGSSTVGVAAYGETSALPRGAFPDEHRIQITDIYSTVFGRHTVKAGVDVNLIHEQIANLFGGDGSFTYSTGTVEAEFANWIQDVYQANGGRHYSSFSQTTDPITGVGADDFWNKNIDGFIQDDWKVTPKLLLSLGARYDVQLVPQPDKPNTTSAPAFAATSVINTDYHMLAPRIGFSFTPYPGTVVRGGYGLFFGLTTNSTWYTLRRENGVYQQQFSLNALANPANTYTTLSGTPGGAPNRQFNVANGSSYQAYAPQGGVPAFTPPGPPPINQVTGTPTPAVNPGLPALTLNVRGAASDFLNPFTHSYDLAVEQELPLHSSLTIGYVGTRGMRLPIFVDSNVDPNSAITRPYYYQGPAGTQAINIPIYTKRLSNNTGSVLTGYSDVNSWYNSMAVSFRKPLSHNIELLANYTWAKTMDAGQSGAPNGTFNGTDAPLIPFAEGHRQGRGAEYSRSDIDQRGRFVGSIVATSKFPIANHYAAYAANGWQLSGTYTAATGFPVTGFVNGTITSAINGDGGPTGAMVTSGTGYRVPDQIARRNSFTGPGVHNLDARISRTFPIHESMAIEVSAESFNLANHRNILAVNNSLDNYTAPSRNRSCASFDRLLGLLRSQRRLRHPHQHLQHPLRPPPAPTAGPFRLLTKTQSQNQKRLRTISGAASHFALLLLLSLPLLFLLVIPEGDLLLLWSKSPLNREIDRCSQSQDFHRNIQKKVTNLSPQKAPTQEPQSHHQNTTNSPPKNHPENTTSPTTPLKNSRKRALKALTKFHEAPSRDRCR